MLQIRPLFALALGLTVLTNGGSALAAATTPEAQTKKLLSFWKEQAATGNEDNKAPLPPSLADVFDYDDLTRAAIEPHKDQFNGKQLGRYTEVFGNLLRRTVHTRAGAAVGKTDYKVSKSSKQGKVHEVVVEAYIPDEDITTVVVFVWQRTDDWRITDVRIDGASLVTDYRNQFGRMINKDGVDGFIAKLESSLARSNG